LHDFTGVHPIPGKRINFVFGGVSFFFVAAALLAVVVATLLLIIVIYTSRKAR
jgi:hypothetical protein